MGWASEYLKSKGKQVNAVGEAYRKKSILDHENWGRYIIKFTFLTENLQPFSTVAYNALQENKAAILGGWKTERKQSHRKRDN